MAMYAHGSFLAESRRSAQNKGSQRNEMFLTLERLEERAAKLQKEFDSLQEFADDLTHRYERHATYLCTEAVRMDIFRCILDQRLSDRDREVLCNYIGYFLYYVLVRIGEELPQYRTVRSYRRLRSREDRDPALKALRCRITGDLGIDETVFEELLHFYKDYCQPEYFSVLKIENKPKEEVLKTIQAMVQEPCLAQGLAKVVSVVHENFMFDQ
ncbi:Single-pass membrane protein with coiled-coil domains 1 [Branchiostoma belcheri]|nr:Single-pass membrane protein with coiled-coil domains 1 [Branchiostoma belcheri]